MQPWTDLPRPLCRIHVTDDPTREWVVDLTTLLTEGTPKQSEFLLRQIQERPATLAPHFPDAVQRLIKEKISITIASVPTMVNAFLETIGGTDGYEQWLAIARHKGLIDAAIESLREDARAVESGGFATYEAWIAPSPEERRFEIRDLLENTATEKGLPYPTAWPYDADEEKQNDWETEYQRYLQEHLPPYISPIVKNKNQSDSKSAHALGHANQTQEEKTTKEKTSTTSDCGRIGAFADVSQEHVVEWIGKKIADLTETRDNIWKMVRQPAGPFHSIVAAWMDRGITLSREWEQTEFFWSGASRHDPLGLDTHGPFQTLELMIEHIEAHRRLESTSPSDEIS